MRMLLKRALHKSFRAECHFKAWGGEIHGVQAQVGALKAVRQQVWCLISIVVEKGWASKAVLQKINGFLAFAFQLGGSYSARNTAFTPGLQTCAQRSGFDFRQAS